MLTRLCICCRPRPRIGSRSGRWRTAWSGRRRGRCLAAAGDPPLRPRSAQSARSRRRLRQERARRCAACSRLGFGFVEIGTVTPRPQARQSQAAAVPAAPQDRALINRLGFNNEGLERGARAARARAGPAWGVIGANIGANRDTADPIAGLRDVPARALPAGRLRHGQRLVAQHAGPARAAAWRAGSRRCSPP